MKTIITALKSAALPVDNFQERLLQIYWEKKNLESFLPQIATYSSTKELTAITLAQLSMIEKELIWLLKDMSNYQNGECIPGLLRKC